MAQGKIKNKNVSKPASTKKGKRSQPTKQPKGGRVVKPKKAKAIQANMVNRKLEKAINQNIEEEIKARASKEPQNFKLLKRTSDDKHDKKK